MLALPAVVLRRARASAVVVVDSREVPTLHARPSRGRGSKPASNGGADGADSDVMARLDAQVLGVCRGPVDASVSSLALHYLGPQLLCPYMCLAVERPRLFRALLAFAAWYLLGPWAVGNLFLRRFSVLFLWGVWSPGCVPPSRCSLHPVSCAPPCRPCSHSVVWCAAQHGCIPALGRRNICRHDVHAGVRPPGKRRACARHRRRCLYLLLRLRRRVLWQIHLLALSALRSRAARLQCTPVPDGPWLAAIVVVVAAAWHCDVQCDVTVDVASLARAYRRRW
jgi:hypothetical protein